MTDSYITKFEKSQMKDKVADVQVGDLVVVHKVIMEGKKERIQRFQGSIIKMKGSNSRKSFTVRKIIDGVGVEKTFLLHSQLVPKIEILQRSKVRRAKLYYLRDRIGAKANRLKVKEETESNVEKKSSELKVDKKTQVAETTNKKTNSESSDS